MCFSANPHSTSADFMRQDMSGTRHRQYPRRGSIDPQADAVFDVFCCGCCPNCSRSCPKSAISMCPKLVFFFDEAHLLFDDCPPALQKRVEQVVRLIRSKEASEYTFARRTPTDAPDVISRPARQSRAARLAARSPPARSEGPYAARRKLSRRIPLLGDVDRRHHPGSASARRWSRPCRTAACRCRSSAR